MIPSRQLWIAERLAHAEKNLRGAVEADFWKVKPDWFVRHDAGSESSFMYGYCRQAARNALADLKPILDYLAETNKRKSEVA